MADYVAMRKKHSATASIREVTANSAAYVGKMIEIRGKIVGLSSRGNIYSIIIDTPTSGSYIVDSETLPENNPGAEIACLVNVGSGSIQSLSDLKLMAFTYEVDLRRKEEAWRLSSIATKARDLARRQPVSRARDTSAARRTIQNGGTRMSTEKFTQFTATRSRGLTSGYQTNRPTPSPEASLAIAHNIRSISDWYVR